MRDGTRMISMLSTDMNGLFLIQGMRSKEYKEKPLNITVNRQLDIRFKIRDVNCEEKPNLVKTASVPFHSVVRLCHI